MFYMYIGAPENSTDDGLLGHVNDAMLKDLQTEPLPEIDVDTTGIIAPTWQDLLGVRCEYK